MCFHASAAQKMAFGEILIQLEYVMNECKMRILCKSSFLRCVDLSSHTHIALSLSLISFTVLVPPHLLCARLAK
jgi:hypothetical protein